MGKVPCSSQPTAPTCVVWSWRLPNTRQRLSFSFPELWYNLLDFNSTKNCQHLTNWTTWNKRDQNKLKHAYLDPMLSFRLHFAFFSASLGHKAMFSLEDILQIADVICPCCVFFSPTGLDRFCRTREMFHHFVLLYQNNATSRPGLLLAWANQKKEKHKSILAPFYWLFLVACNLGDLIAVYRAGRSKFWQLSAMCKKKVMHTLLWALSLLISSTMTCYLRETSNRGNVFSVGLSYTHLKLIIGERIALYASVYNISWRKLGFKTK